MSFGGGGGGVGKGALYTSLGGEKGKKGFPWGGLETFQYLVIMGSLEIQLWK